MANTEEMHNSWFQTADGAWSFFISSMEKKLQIQNDSWTMHLKHASPELLGDGLEDNLQYTKEYCKIKTVYVQSYN